MADWYKTSQEGETPPEDNSPNLAFTGRRSDVLCREYAVCSSQPLASAIGCQILQAGNAADAAIAVAAALAVLEPCSTGLGGDMFALYYRAATQSVHCINGSGKSPAALDPSLIHADTFRDSALSVTVPGAAAGWEDFFQTFGSGKLSFRQVLEPAARLAEDGFPVSEITSHHWTSGMAQITKWLDDDEAIPLVKAGTHRTPPRCGDLVRNPDMARVLRSLGDKGAQDGFYQENADAIVEVLTKFGGVMSREDLEQHTSSFPDPIHVDFQEHRLWQAPPNGQGIAGLIALSGFEAVYEGCPVGSPDWWHTQIEMMRLGFADARQHVCCPDAMGDSQLEKLLDRERIQTRAQKLFEKEKAAIAGSPEATSCTVSFQVVDKEGNAVSFVNSNFQGFGTGIIPPGCGFTLQNRGFGFSLDPRHPNAVGPGKRPYHTIIPGMLTRRVDGKDILYATLTNMGGNMQPQGHLQLTLDMLIGGMSPQRAIDQPRFCIADGQTDGVVFLEDGVPDDVVHELHRRGHKLNARVSAHKRSVFGRAQIIKKDPETGVLWCGSDGRADGCAMGF